MRNHKSVEDTTVNVGIDVPGLHQVRGKQANAFGQGAGVKKKRHPYVENTHCFRRNILSTVNKGIHWVKLTSKFQAEVVFTFYINKEPAAIL